MADATGEFRIAVSLTPGGGPPGRQAPHHRGPAGPATQSSWRAGRRAVAGCRHIGHPDGVLEGRHRRWEEALVQWQAAGERRQEARTLTLLARTRNAPGIRGQPSDRAWGSGDLSGAW